MKRLLFFNMYIVIQTSFDNLNGTNINAMHVSLFVCRILQRITLEGSAFSAVLFASQGVVSIFCSDITYWSLRILRKRFPGWPKQNLRRKQCWKHRRSCNPQHLRRQTSQHTPQTRKRQSERLIARSIRSYEFFESQTQRHKRAASRGVHHKYLVT